MKLRHLAAALLAGLIFGTAAPLYSQGPFAAQIQAAIRGLTAGTTPFTVVTIGTVGSPTSSQFPLVINANRNGQVQAQLNNVNTGTSAYTEWVVKSGTVTAYFGAETTLNSDTFGQNRAYFLANTTDTAKVSGIDFYGCAATGSNCFGLPNIRFITHGATASQVRMTIDETGVGVGTDVPGFFFHAKKSSNVFGDVLARIENTNTGNAAYSVIDATAGTNNIRIYTPSQGVALQEGFMVTSGTMAMNFGIGNAAYWQITGGGTIGNLIPYANNSYDLGSLTRLVRVGYFQSIQTSQISISNAIGANVNPTISSGFGGSPSVPTKNGTFGFTINVGTGGAATNGVIAFNLTAANGWAIKCDDITTQSTTVFITKQKASSTTTATIANYNTAGAEAAWVASDILSCLATAY